MAKYFGSIKEYEVEIFGEKYDLSKCTPEERTQVETWYEKSKEVDVPVAADTSSNRPITEVNKSIDVKPSGELDFELAVESLKSNTDFNPTLTGRPEVVAFYRAVHPLGGNLSLTEATQQAGINRVTGFRWLKRLHELNPDTYDLDKWPTKAQCDVYRLIHPSLGGLTYREAARALKSTYQHVVSMMGRMRKSHPQAFVFERLPRPTIKSYEPESHDEQAAEKY